MPGKRKRPWSGSRKGGKRAKGPGSFLQRSSGAWGASRRGPAAGTGTLLNRFSLNLPDRLGIRVRTFVTLSFTYTGGTPANISYIEVKLNTVYQPFSGASSTATNATIQNLSTMYNHCQVMAAKVKINWVPASGNGNVAGWATGYAISADNAITPSTTNTNIGPQAARSRNVVVPTPGGYTGKCMMTEYVSCSQVAGLTPAQYRDQAASYSCLSNGSQFPSDPSGLVLYTIVCTSADKTNAGSLIGHIQLDQWCVLYSRYAA